MAVHMVNALFISLVSLFCAARGSAGDNAQNLFNLPGPAGPGENYAGDMVWPLGSLQTVDFYTNIDSWQLMLVQQNLDSNNVNFLNNITSDNRVGHINFQWEVQIYDADLQTSPVFFFWVNYGDRDNFTSHYFNITNGNASTAATSSIVPSMTSTSAPSSGQSTALGGVVRGGSGSMNVDPSGATDDEATKIGLGVGLGVGLPLAAAAVGILIWKIRCGKKTAQSGFAKKTLSGGPEVVQKEGQPVVAIPGYQYSLISHGPFEAPAENSPVELAASEDR